MWRYLILNTCAYLHEVINPFYSFICLYDLGNKQMCKDGVVASFQEAFNESHFLIFTSLLSPLPYCTKVVCMTNRM